MSLRAKINNYAKEHGILAQVVLQNYMFECLLDRISRSKYVDNFVIKGGILVSSLVGLDVRSTMDMDTTLVHLSLTEEKIKEAMNAIITVPADDGVVFNFVSVEPIRKDDVYGGFCLRLDAKYESIETPLSIDISTGDAITPEPINYGYKRLFNSENVIPLRSYPLETVLAEKIETIITRGILNTRPRDFYDVYILTKTQGYNAETLRKAIFATAEHRGTKAIMEAETNSRLAVIENSSELQSQWAKYQKKFPYAKDITYQETVNAVKEVIHEIYI
ncbi:nucleotidyl transferase AbiEii/AbiGii toxin family protein [Treponema rectale]|uniref:Nucleotidyl transferase AbiEii/AbiGii toxin family protein n=2 Tax=Treponema rectale TaxID=744512 RepID=A0A7M1XQ83_9SPIR|nr:nucleotidyl transferase AbiEii/AbiGii toxin family protein [Treponema rectale]